MSRNQLSLSFLPSHVLTLWLLPCGHGHIKAVPLPVTSLTCFTTTSDVVWLCCYWTVVAVLTGLRIPNFLPRIICEEFNANLFLHQCFPLTGRGFSSLPHPVQKPLGCLCCCRLARENRLRLRHVKVCCRAEISFLHESFP